MISSVSDALRSRGDTHRALVLRGPKSVTVDTVATRPLKPGELRVRIAAAGVCGTDLHYFKDFGNAGFKLAAPVVLGHEAAGVVAAVGPDVEGFAVADKVAINPVMNCGNCLACRRGDSNLCERKRFPGSATTVPHIDGYFQEHAIVEARCCTRVPDDADLTHIAFAEPLACAMHGVRRAGILLGRRVLVTGSGPIGTLVVAAAKAAGAGHVTVTDLIGEPLAIAHAMGADVALNIMNNPLADHVARHGPFEVAFEASGSPDAFRSCMASLRRGGTLVQLGITPPIDSPVAINMIMLKELAILGSNQFTDEFETALAMILSGRIDVSLMLSATLALDSAAEAFALAADRRRSMKVQFAP